MILLVLAVVLLGSLPAAAQEPDDERGSEIYSDNCAMCHGDDAGGMMGMHPSLRGAMERLSRDGVEVTIRRGRDVRPPMPAFEGRLSDRDISDLVAYLETLPVGPRNFGDDAEGSGGMGGMMRGAGAMWLIAGLLALALAAAVAVLLRRRDRGAGRSAALRILEERYARGDIDHEEFEERRRRLDAAPHEPS